jgi:hypothetical protein
MSTESRNAPEGFWSAVCRNRRAAGRGVLWVAVIALVAFQAVNIMRAANWAPGDDYIFTRTTVAGEWMGFREQIRTYERRFFPLAFQEFNLLVGAGNVPRLYYALQLAKYFLTLLVMALIARVVLRRGGSCGGLGASWEGEHSGVWKATLGAGVIAAVFLLQPRLHLVYGHIIYPESMQMLWLSLFALFAYRAVGSGRWWDYLASLLAGSVALYYKETTFALLLPVAVVPLVGRYRSMKPAQRAFSIGLLLSIGLWFGLYWHLVYSQAGGADYASKYATHKSLAVSFARVFLDPTTIYPVMAALGVYRAWILARAVYKGRSAELSMEQLLVDSLLFGGLLCIAAFAALKLADIRYLPPSNVFFTVVCLYYAPWLITRLRGWLGRAWRSRRALALAALGGVLMWTSSRLTCQVVGFRWLHDIQRTWAPHLRVVAHHSDCPVIFVCPDYSGPWPADRPCPLNLYFVKASLACIRVQKPEGTAPVQPAYLDMTDELNGVDALSDWQIRIDVLDALPAGERYFLFAPTKADNFGRLMQERYGIDVVRISRFAFRDPWVREIWVPRAFARRLRREHWLPVGAARPVAGEDPR